MEQGERVLVEGRFRECERLAAEAALLAPSEAAPAVLAALACREQARASEAEALVRALLADHPGDAEGHALLSAILADLGRDAEARRQLDVLDPAELWDRSSPATALAAETAAALASPGHAESFYAALVGHGTQCAGCHGSVARHLGLMCHVLGRWYEAESHFQVALDANQAIGAPVLLAHTRRHYAALLRARGDDGDWEQAIDLLAEAATIYRRLDIGRLADEAEAVLRRSLDPLPAGAAGDDVHHFRPTGAGWDLQFGGRRAMVADGPGLAHLARLLVADGRPVHVLDLVQPTAEETQAEYEAALASLDGDPGTAGPVATALAQAERDLLAAELRALTEPPDTDVTERARRLVALRIRTALDRVEAALPALGRHLRSGVRTGTFCIYEPERPERWKMGG